MGTSDNAQLVLILGIAAAAIYIGNKSGIFGLAKKTGEIASDVVTDVGALPANIVTLVSEAPEILRAIGWNLGLNTYDILQVSERSQNIVNALNKAYPNLPTLNDRARQSLADGNTFDAKGNLIPGPGLTTTPSHLSYYIGGGSQGF